MRITGTLRPRKGNLSVESVVGLIDHLKDYAKTKRISYSCMPDEIDNSVLFWTDGYNDPQKIYSLISKFGFNLLESKIEEVQK